MAETPNVRRVPVERVILEDDLQSRVKLDTGHIAEMREWLIANPKDDLPPARCVKVGSEFYPHDGWHRREAYEAAGRLTMPVEFTEGTLRDAKLLAAGANLGHGLKRTNADKRKAVLTLLQDDEWSGWTDRAIAEHCGVHHDLVGSVRRELSSVAESATERNSRETLRGKDGRTQKNPAITKLSLARSAPAPQSDDDIPDDAGETEGTAAARNTDPNGAAVAKLEDGEEWLRELISLVRAAGRYDRCRGPLEAIKGALLDLRKGFAGEKAA